MPLGLRSHTSPTSPRRRRGVLAFLKRWTIPVIGGVTPVGLMVINIAAFLVKHLDQFRWAIAILAFMSGMMLNSYMGLNVYRFIQRRFPDFPPVQPRNEELAVALGMGVITVITFVLAYETYQGLTADQLPGGFTFIYGAIQIASVIVVKLFFDRERERRDRQSTSPSPPQPTTPPPSAAAQSEAAAPAPPGRGGFVPPP